MIKKHTKTCRHKLSILVKKIKVTHIGTEKEFAHIMHIFAIFIYLSFSKSIHSLKLIVRHSHVTYGYISPLGNG